MQRCLGSEAQYVVAQGLHAVIPGLGGAACSDSWACRSRMYDSCAVCSDSYVARGCL